MWISYEGWLVFSAPLRLFLITGHIIATWRIQLSHPSAAAMHLMSNYFDHLLSLATPTQTVAQIAERFEANTVLCAFRTIQPSIVLL